MGWLRHAARCAAATLLGSRLAPALSSAWGPSCRPLCTAALPLRGCLLALGLLLGQLRALLGLHPTRPGLAMRRDALLLVGCRAGRQATCSAQLAAVQLDGLANGDEPAGAGWSGTTSEGWPHADGWGRAHVT